MLEIMTTIAIIAQKGGAGKTTLAVHLAAEAERNGQVALVVDMDAQASAFQWGLWREGAPPDVIDCPPPLLARKIAQAQEMGAGFIVIDTPPHADSAATSAAAVADMLLIPCRPRALDLHAIQLTARLVEATGKRAYVVFMGGPPNARKLYEEATNIVKGYGLDVAPHIIPERAAYHHATGQGRAAFEIEPNGKAAEDMSVLWTWISTLVNKKA